MTRVSTAQITQSALLDIQRAQQSLFKATGQTGNQNKATDLKGYGPEAHTLVSSSRVAARIEGRLEQATELQTRLSIQESTLSRASEIVADLRDTVLQGVGLRDGTAVDEKIEEAFYALKDIFNTNLAGKYVFGGTANDSPPVTVANTADLVTNGAANAFGTNGNTQLVNPDGVQEIQIAPVAHTDALEFFQVLEDLASGGPYGADIDDTERAYLQGLLPDLDSAYNKSIELESTNGRTQARINTIVERQETQLNALNESTGRITDVDLAEVAFELSQAQISYQASASIFAQIRNLSLVNVL